MSRGQSQPRTQCRRRGLGRCRSKGNTDNVVIIDADKDKADVVIVDAPETSHKRSRCSRATSRNSSPSNDVISIDDEDTVDDDNPRNVYNDASSKTFCPASSSSPLSEESETDECLMLVGKEKVPSKLTKNMRMYPTRGSSRNCVGSGPVSESSTSESDSSELNISESDSSDCEIIEDSSGNIREQWERAAFRKKMSERGQFGPEDRASASGSSADPGFPSHETTQDKVDVANSKLSNEVPVQSCPSNSSNGNENLSASMTSADGLNGDPLLDPKGNNSVADSNPTAGSCHQGPPFERKEELIPEKSSSHRAQSSDETLDHKKPGFQDQDTPVLGSSLCNTHFRHEIHAKYDRDSFLKKDGWDYVKTSFGTSELRGDTSFQDQEGPYSGKPSSCNPQTWDENQVSHERNCFQEKETIPGEPSCCTQSRYGSDVNHEFAVLQKKEKSNFGESSLCNTQSVDGPQLNVGSDYFDASEDAILGEPKQNLQAGTGTPGRSHSSSTGHDDMPQIQNDLIGGREKHKESDEYRRASEEEWASRQQQLQIQAEEAQKMRKRRKAENMRLLDVERRQKQRLEEMRDSQKKDEETIHLKEQIRVQIRKELDKMEVRYRDMASLLRELGIHVEGGLFPMSCEVNAAYKRALLRFHPDRASKTDIRQQVEAEETFKLISRLKEKLLPGI